VRVAASGGQAVARNYSLCGEPKSGTYVIVVKNEGGLASAFLHERVRKGDFLEVSAPRGSFTLVYSAKPIVLLSAGIGITPLLAMLRSMARDTLRVKSGGSILRAIGIIRVSQHNYVR
jgi:ferredoxin-NADP reductase